jgi:hypothetical protein
MGWTHRVGTNGAALRPVSRDDISRANAAREAIELGSA